MVESFAPLPLVFANESIEEDGILPVEEHPTDDPELPCYQSEQYREILPHLLTMRELWQGQSAWLANGKITNISVARKYLPQEQAESEEAYRARLIRSPFENFIEPAIAGFAGLLSDIRLGDSIDPSIVANQTNIDLQENNLQTFWTLADTYALRDGMVGILVEYPPEPTDENGEPIFVTFEQQQALQRRPYLCLVERADLINWDADYFNGRFTLNQITVRERHEIKEGRFGKKTVTRYRVMTPGRYEVWEIVRGRNGNPTGRIIEQGRLVARGKEIPIPIVFYAVSDLNPFQAAIPMINLAALNVRHFQTTSDYYEVLRKCNLPVPVRKGFVVEGQKDFQSLPPVVLGPNTVVDIPSSGEFGFAEPSGAAISATRQAILDLESAILKRTLAFLADSEGTRTATEANLRSTQTQSLIQNLAVRKESALEAVFDKWAQYEGREKGGRPEVVKDLLIDPLDPNEINALSNLADRGQLSLKTLLQVLVAGKVLPRDLDPDEEIEEIFEQKQTDLNLAVRSASQQQDAIVQASMQSGLLSGIESDDETTEDDEASIEDSIEASN